MDDFIIEKNPCLRDTPSINIYGMGRESNLLKTLMELDLDAFIETVIELTIKFKHRDTMIDSIVDKMLEQPDKYTWNDIKRQIKRLSGVLYTPIPVLIRIYFNNDDHEEIRQLVMNNERAFESLLKLTRTSNPNYIQDHGLAKYAKKIKYYVTGNELRYLLNEMSLENIKESLTTILVSITNETADLIDLLLEKGLPPSVDFIRAYLRAGAPEKALELSEYVDLTEEELVRVFEMDGGRMLPLLIEQGKIAPKAISALSSQVNPDVVKRLMELGCKFTVELMVSLCKRHDNHDEEKKEWKEWREGLFRAMCRECRPSLPDMLSMSRYSIVAAEILSEECPELLSDPVFIMYIYHEHEELLDRIPVKITEPVKLFKDAISWELDALMKKLVDEDHILVEDISSTLREYTSVMQTQCAFYLIDKGWKPSLNDVLGIIARRMRSENILDMLKLIDTTGEPLSGIDMIRILGCCMQQNVTPDAVNEFLNRDPDIESNINRYFTHILLLESHRFEENLIDLFTSRGCDFGEVNRLVRNVITSGRFGSSNWIVDPAIRNFWDRYGVDIFIAPKYHQEIVNRGSLPPHQMWELLE